MEGFGQQAAFRFKLTKQTWAVFHWRWREQQQMGSSGDGVPDGKKTLPPFHCQGWGNAAAHGSHCAGAGWEGRVWGQRQGEGARDEAGLP